MSAVKHHSELCVFWCGGVKSPECRYRWVTFNLWNHINTVSVLRFQTFSSHEACIYTDTHAGVCIYMYLYTHTHTHIHFWLKRLQEGAHLLWVNSITRKCHSLLCYLLLRTKPTFVSFSGLPASLPETQQVFSISLRPMNDKEHRQQIRNNFKHCRNINRTLTANWVIFFFKEHTAQQSHPTLKIPTQNSCKRQNPLPRSLPLSIHWTLLSRQRLKGIPLGHSQNQPLYRFVSALHLRNRVVSEPAAHCQPDGRPSNSAPDRLKKCSLSEQQVNASQEKLSEIRPVAKL